MLLASQRQNGAQTLLVRRTCHDGYDLVPEATLHRKTLCVAENKEAMLGSRQRHTSSIVNSQEPNAARVVTPHQGQENDVILFALVGVHGHNLRQEVCQMGIRLHISQEQLPLTVVEGQYGYLHGVNAVQHEVDIELHDHRGLEIVRLGAKTVAVLGPLMSEEP